MIDLPPVTDWFPATIDPVRTGWYECRYFDTDLPQRLWFDGALWRHEPGGDTTYFGNDGDEAERESWRGLSLPAVALVRRPRRWPS